MKKELILILDNIRSMYNVGAIFRVAEGLGVSKLFLCGITPTPPRKEIHKTALGADFRVEWEHVEKTEIAVKNLKTIGYQITALELTPKSIPISKFVPSFPLALIIGHEREGVGDDLLNSASSIVEIPMHGKVLSLNVSTATAIAVWHILNI